MVYEESNKIKQAADSENQHDLLGAFYSHHAVCFKF